MLINKGGALKIGDLGLTEYSDNQSMSVTAVYYAAPENFKKGPMTTKSDIYSFGLIVNFIFTSEEHLRYSKFETKIKKEADVFFPLVQACINQVPDERPSAWVIEEQLDKFDKFMRENLPKDIFKYRDLAKIGEEFMKIYNLAQKNELIPFI